MRVIELDVKNRKLISKKWFEKEPTFGEYPIDKSKIVVKCNNDLLIFDNVPYHILEYNFIEFEKYVYIIKYNKWIDKDMYPIWGGTPRNRYKSLYCDKRHIYNILGKLGDFDLNEMLISNKFLFVMSPINSQELNKLRIDDCIEIIFSPFTSLDNSYSKKVYEKQIDALRHGAKFDTVLKKYVKSRIDRELIGLKMDRIFNYHNISSLNILDAYLEHTVNTYIDFWFNH